MNKVLYITANPKTTDLSFGLTVGQAFLEAYRQESPNDEIRELDLFNSYIPEIDEDVLGAWGKLGQGISFEDLTKEEQGKVSRIDELTAEFKDFDKYVFVTPMWNLSYPPKVKAYIDTLMIAGKTFKYTENGPVGLLEGKKAVHIQARGGFYSEGPAAEMEFGDRHLKAVLSFMGITEFESIPVEGMAFTPDKAEEIKMTAIEKAKEVAKKFAKVEQLV
ncbi:FMN-dependent NADH-azoreductase [Metabacillus litoralis]|uniref:FMN-dependent NADH-azoreductase n=1 Tax=Metabacillus litoralis TaxID=152268 RepID=UPI001CFEEF99|nr:FMN-dependent NADH-azoreductase [Metabacillus litoralis]